jgi:hypothetical protein
MSLRAFAVATFGLLPLASACTSSHVDNPTLTTPSSISPTATASVAGDPGPCDLATATHLQAAFGGAASAGRLTSTGTQCDWLVTGSNLDGANLTVTLALVPAQAPAAFNAANAAIGGVHEPELGTDAYWVPRLSTMTVLLGTHAFTVQAVFAAGTHLDPVAVEADALTFARSVEAALPN